MSSRPVSARRARGGGRAPVGTSTTSAATPRDPWAPAVPAVLALAGAWSWRILAVGLAVYFVVTFLASLPLVTLPVFLALLLTALLRRPALFLRQFLPRWVAALAAVLGAVLIVGLVGWFVAVRLESETDATINQAQQVLSQLRERLSGLPAIGGSSSSLVDLLNSWAQSHSSTLVSGAVTVGRTTLDVLTGLVLTLFLTLFFLIDGEREWSWVVRLLPRRARPAANGAGRRAFGVLSGWITGTAIIAAIHGLVIGLTMWLLGTPLVEVLAVLIVIGSFIPLVGAIVFGGLAVLVTLLTVGPVAAVILLAVLIISSLLEAHVYQPLIIGRSVRLHPVAILLALSAGALMGGIAGAIVAIPVLGAGHAAVKYLTGIEDIHGDPVGDEDRMAPEPPPDVLVRRAAPHRPATGVLTRRHPW
jgi:predicted PurR-regulated permease PerM